VGVEGDGIATRLSAGTLFTLRGVSREGAPLRLFVRPSTGAESRAATRVGTGCGMASRRLGESPLNRFHAAGASRRMWSRGLRLIECTAGRGEVIHDPQAERVEGLHSFRSGGISSARIDRRSSRAARCHRGWASIRDRFPGARRPRSHRRCVDRMRGRAPPPRLGPPRRFAAMVGFVRCSRAQNASWPRLIHPELLSVRGGTIRPCRARAEVWCVPRP